MRSRAVPLLLLVFAAGGPALASDRPGADWMPIDGAHKALREAGYEDVTAIEADDGRWEAKAVKDGRPVKAFVDPRSGAVTSRAR